MAARFALLAGLLAAALAVAGCASATPEPGTSSGGQTALSNSTTETKESSVLTEPTPSGTFTTQSPAKPTAPVTITGTPAAGVEAGCLLLGEYLLIGGPRDLLAGGRPITVTGRPDTTFRSICQQGIPLIVESADLLTPTTG